MTPEERAKRLAKRLTRRLLGIGNAAVINLWEYEQARLEILAEIQAACAAERKRATSDECERCQAIATSYAREMDRIGQEAAKSGAAMNMEAIGGGALAAVRIGGRIADV